MQPFRSKRKANDMDQYEILSDEDGYVRGYD
jgi:hypothetical protein